MIIPDVSNKKLAELLSLRGKRAVVTGAGRGLGKAICRRFAEAGASVLIGDIDEAAARATAQSLSAEFGVKAFAALLDAADGDSVKALARTAADQLGGIDIWVNNAGIFPSRPALEIQDDEWDRVLDINLRGVFIGCREAARVMVQAGQGGVIINMASVAGMRGLSARIASYVASKFGVRGLTEQLAIEFAPDGIRVLGVAPTTIDTEGVRSGLGDREINSGILGRTGVPDDIARVVLFCASDMSNFMTGSTLHLEAGRLSLG